MARYKNSVSLIGVVGRNAEIRNTSAGVPYARFSLATSTGGYKKQDGTQVPEQTQWHNIVCWRKQAEFAGKYVKKGMKVSVDGMIIYGSYQNQQGQTERTCEIVAAENGIIMMTCPDAMQGQAQRQQAPQGNGYLPQNNDPQQAKYQQQGSYSQPEQKPQDSAFPFPEPSMNDCPY